MRKFGGHLQILGLQIGKDWKGLSEHGVDGKGLGGGVSYALIFDRKLCEKLLLDFLNFLEFLDFSWIIFDFLCFVWSWRG